MVILILGACALAGKGMAMEGAAIPVARFGATPDDGQDDTAAIRAAIEACRKEPGARLIFAPGRYDLRAGADRQPLLPIVGFDDLNIEGNGAELVGSGLATLFHVANCKRFAARDLTVDWDPLPFTGGKVVATGDLSFDVEVAPPHTAQAGVRAEAWLEYDPAHGRLAHRGREHYQMDFERTTEVPRPGVVRAFVNRPGALPKVGTDVVVRHRVYSYNAFSFRQVAAARLEDVTLYACPGMGLAAGDSGEFTLRRFNVLLRPGSGRWMSTTADATHFNACRGPITVEDCLFEGMGDDSINIHNMHQVVVARADDRTLHLVEGKQPRRVPALPRPGDRLELGGGENPLVPYATLTVESATADRQAGVAVVRFTEALPARAGKDDVVGNASTCPVARIRRCTVRRNRARGMLIQTRDVLLEDCTFEDVSGAALHITADANYWWEGMGVRNVVIRNNRFRNCHFGAARHHGVIDVFAEVGKALAGPGVHRDITIEGNVFEDADPAAIHVGSAEGVVIRGNTFARPSDAAILVANTRRVTVTGNRLVGGGQGIRLADGTDAATVEVRGNEGFAKE